MKLHNRTTRVLALAAVTVGISLSCLETCEAQVRRYEPQSPTLSPYLGLSLFNNGSVPNYYAFVRPRIQQRELNLREQALTRQNTAKIQRIANEVQRGAVPVTQTGIGSWFLDPGTRTTYLDTTKYYPDVNITRHHQ